jgi:hypothetical protein
MVMHGILFINKGEPFRGPRLLGMGAMGKGSLTGGIQFCTNRNSW